MTFKVGDPKPPNAGRRRGTPNKASSQIREVITQAAYHLGGWERLVAWVRESEQNEFAFWTSIWPRLLPLMRLHGTAEIGEIGLSAKIEPGEIAHRLMELGLPTSLFDNDVPTLDEQSNGNRDDEPPEGSRTH